MPLFLCLAARVASAGAVIMRRATSDIPTSLYFFWARETNIRDIVTKILHIKAEEPHKPVDMLIFFPSRLDLMLWRVENNECSRSSSAFDALNRNRAIFEMRTGHFKLEYQTNQSSQEQTDPTSVFLMIFFIQIDLLLEKIRSHLAIIVGAPNRVLMKTDAFLGQEPRF